jgi:quinol monooxygenase YgiN
MSTISIENNLVRFINVWSVDPANQQQLVDLSVEIIEAVQKTEVGFVSASIHQSLDGSQVIIYAQWRSQEDWMRSLKNPELTSRAEKMTQIGKPLPKLYQVVYAT